MSPGLYLTNLILLLASVFLWGTAVQAQVTRGASPGEIYISTGWYAGHDGVHYAILYSADNGENISVQYESTETPPQGEMKIGKVLGDAASGALYNYGHNELWVSFDYGASWEFRENYSYAKYAGGFSNGEILRRSDYNLYRSVNYGLNFELIVESLTEPLSDVGNQIGEFYGFTGSAGIGYTLYHSNNFGNNFTAIPIDSSIAFWQVSGKYPEISRGTEPGELYLVSWWPDYHYKIFHSIDTGYTWTLKYESDYIDLFNWGVQYTAGRQPGSFYVKRSTLDPSYNHSLLYIDYSSDYGETFTTYFHELDSLFTSVAPEQKQIHGLTISPNPATNKISIVSGNRLTGKTTISVISMKGEQVMQRKFQSQNPVEMDMSMLAKGIYLVKIQSGEGIENKKLIIQ